MTENVTELSRRDIHAFPRSLMAELEKVVLSTPAEMQWSVDGVGEELIFALRLCNKTVGRVMPMGDSAAWPVLLREWSDLLAQVEAGEDGRADGPRRFSATREQISRMERAISWQGRYLGKPEHEVLRKVLAIWLRCKTRRGASFSKALQHHRIARPTAYRALDRALLIIAIGLMRDGIPLP